MLAQTKDQLVLMQGQFKLDSKEYGVHAMTGSNQSVPDKKTETARPEHEREKEQ